MDVRPVRLADAPHVLALALDQQSHLIHDAQWPAGNPLPRTIFHTLVPLALPSRAWIARDGRSAGLLEACPRRYAIAWDIVRLVARGDRDAVLAALLQEAIAYLGRRGVPRLFLRCQADEVVTLRPLGFEVLARELVLFRERGEASEEVPIPVDSRYRLPQDAWPLHQLENEITPALVRQIEGLNSSDWSHRARHMSEIVVERDGRIVAWIGWGNRPRSTHVPIRMLLHPEHRDVGQDLLQHALENASSRHGFTSRVRNYQVETLSTFMDAGFSVVAEESLMVKHGLVQRVQVAKRRLRAARAPAIPAMPLNVTLETLEAGQ